MSTQINQSWQMSGFGLSKLSQVTGKIPEFGLHELLVRTKAVSLNCKDKLIVDGTLIPDLAFPFVPTSDAVGEVVAVGGAVSRFKVGQRVLGQVIADWPDGDAPPVLHKHTLGSSLPGMLSDYVVFGEDAAVLAPPSLSDIEAATLPIAALTAWFALVDCGCGLCPSECDTSVCQDFGTDTTCLDCLTANCTTELDTCSFN